MRKSQRDLLIKNQISNIFLTTPNDRVYGDVLSVILSNLKSRFGIFGYLNENEDLVEPSLTREIWEKCAVEDKTVIFPKELWSKNIFGRVINRKKTIFSNKSFNVPEGHVPISNFLGTPIVYRDKVIGILIVANREGVYREKDVEKLESFANYISPILKAKLQTKKHKNQEIKARKDLKESEEKFRNIADQSLFGICILQDGVIKYVNQHLSEIYGYTIEEIKNWAPGEFIKVFHPEDKDMVLDQALKKQSGLTDVANHCQFGAIKRTGETIWIENFSKTIIHDGKTANLVAIIDITEIKKVENALKEREHDLRDSLKEIRNSEKNLKDLMEAIPIGVLVSSPNGEIHDLNSQTLEIFGYNSKDEFLKISTQDHYYDPKEGEKFIASMIKEGFIKDFRALFKRKDGTLIWGLVNSISQVNNKQTLFINTFQDISDRIKAEEEIADLAKFPSENPNPVLRVNEEFVLYVNKVGQNLFKVKEGNRIPNLLREIIRKAFEDYKLRQVEVNLNNRVYSLVITPVKGTGYINIYGMDITKRIQAEKMLRKFKIS